MGPRKGLVHSGQHDFCFLLVCSQAIALWDYFQLIALRALSWTRGMKGTSPETQLASLLALQGLMIQVIQVSQEALRDFGQSHNEEENRVTWEGEGRWEAGTNRMVSCEEERGVQG